MTDDAMTKISIDEQIADVKGWLESDPGNKYAKATLASLRRLKRIMELLRKPSEEMISAGLAEEGHIDDEFKAMSAALLAQVEKEMK